MKTKQGNQEQLLSFQEEIFKEDGHTSIKIHGNCMWPVLKDGDLVTIEKSQRENIKIGDIAIFKTTKATLHANVCFNKKAIMEETSAEANRFFGRATSTQRNSKKINLDRRSKWTRLWGLVLCPSNPYLLGFLRKLINK